MAGSPARTRGQPLDGLSLRWHAPEGCPDEAAVLARVRAHRPSEHRVERHWFAQANVTAEGGGYRLDLVLRGPESEARRSLDDDNCAALAEAAALLVALALDPASTGFEAADRAEPAPPAGESAGDANARNTKERSKPTPSPTRDRDGAGERRPAQSGERTRSSATHGDATADSEASAAGPLALAWDAGAALRLDFGMLPQAPALGLQPRLGLRLGRMRIAVGLTLWFEARSAAERYPRATLAARGLLGDAAVCVQLLRARLTLAPCVAGELGQLTLETHAISAPATSPVRYAAAGGGAHAAYRITGGLEATLELLALAPFERPRWLLQTGPGVVEVFVTAPVAVRIAAGIAYVFD